MNTASRKAKGRRLQQMVRQDLIDVLGIPPELIRTTIMGETGRDIQDASGLVPVTIECKNQETLNIWRAIEQAKWNAHDDEIPGAVVFKKNGQEPWIAIPWGLFLEYLHELKQRGYLNGKSVS